MNECRKSYVCKIDDVSESDRTVTHVVTTDHVDRSKEVVMPDGIDLTKYRANPVVLLEHGKSEYPLPIGKNIWIKRSLHGAKRGLIAKTKFADTEMGRECMSLYAEGILSAWSIGLLVRDQGPMTPTERQSRSDWVADGCRNVIRTSEMIEYSVVRVPANPEAITIAKNKGLTLPDWLDIGGGLADPPQTQEGTSLGIPAGRKLASVEASLLRRLKTFDLGRVAEQAARDAIDRVRGRV